MVGRSFRLASSSLVLHLSCFRKFLRTCRTQYLYIVRFQLISWYMFNNPRRQMLERWFRLSGCSVFSETDVSQPTENEWKKQPKKNIERTSEGVKLLLKSTLKNYKSDSLEVKWAVAQGFCTDPYILWIITPPILVPWLKYKVSLFWGSYAIMF